VEGRQSHSREHWEQSLNDYVLPVIGQLPVALVEKSHVLAVLKPHWESKTVTMERIRGRIEVIPDWAKGHGLRSGDNPASWKGNLDAGSPDQVSSRRSRTSRLCPTPMFPRSWPSCER
jgi:hypothetical protein